MLKTRPRRIIFFVVLFFILYAIYQDPDKSGDVVGNIWGIIQNAVERIFDFFDSIISDNPDN